MRIIQKEISLEPMTSRLPSIIPAYKDNELYFFDDQSIRRRSYLYTSNYGMIPMSIVLEKDPKDCTGYTDYNISTNADCGGFKISFENLSKLYHFFEEYYHILNDYGKCGKSYSSATEFYYYESVESPVILHGLSEYTYEELDEKFRRMGGQVDMEKFEIERVAEDVGLYKWICENIVPTYYISQEYKDYWKTVKLYYPDVIRWMAWFEKRLQYEEVFTAGTDGNPDTWDCKPLSGDCCDCEEYFNRGGQRELDRMKDWYNTIQQTIEHVNNIINGSRECFEPSVISEIELQTSLEDLGQFSIFSKELELGVDYRVAKDYDTGNTMSGTVVTVSGETKILISGDSEGFGFDPYYMKKYFDEEQWADYTKMYISDHPEEFVSSSYKYYAFDDEGEIKTSTSDSVASATTEIIDKMQKEYPLTKSNSGWIYKDGTFYPIQKTEYGVVRNKLTSSDVVLFVYRDEHTETPYTYYNGKKIYGEFYQPNAVYYFELFKNETRSENCGKLYDNFKLANYKIFPRRTPIDNEENADKFKRYIMYNGLAYTVNEYNQIIIDSIPYEVINAYAYDEDGSLMVVPDGSDRAYYTDGLLGLIEVDNSVVNGDYIRIPFTGTPKVYSVRELTGTTKSRIYGLRVTNLVVDSVGNTIEAYNTVDGTDVSSRGYNLDPIEGEELEPIYQIGNTANVQRMKLTDSEEDGNTNYFVGDIITEMSFYYKEIGGETCEETRVTLSDDTDITSSLWAIKEARRLKESRENSYDMLFEDDIYCDITYYIGATLMRTKESSGLKAAMKLAYDPANPEYNYGVEYKETVRFVKQEVEYYLKYKRLSNGTVLPCDATKPSEHTISYPVYIYALTQEMSEVKSERLGDFNEALATFKCEINIIDEDLGTTFQKYKDMDAYNGIRVSPVFRQEHLLGFSSLENAESDIYIERGINSAFERHLKLQEVSSLDDLTQYGNGYFKIMNNE